MTLFQEWLAVTAYLHLLVLWLFDVSPHLDDCLAVEFLQPKRDLRLFQGRMLELQLTK